MMHDAYVKLYLLMRIFKTYARVQVKFNLFLNLLLEESGQIRSPVAQVLVSLDLVPSKTRPLDDMVLRSPGRI